MCGCSSTTRMCAGPRLFCSPTSSASRSSISVRSLVQRAASGVKADLRVNLTGAPVQLPGATATTETSRRFHAPARICAGPARRIRMSATETPPVWDLSDLYSGLDDPRIQTDLQDVLQRAQAFEAQYRGKI